MKSFLGGLCLATGLALLNSISASPAAMCVIFPDLRAAVATQPVEDDCIRACRMGRSRRPDQ
jgi:hypothetical protein